MAIGNTVAARAEGSHAEGILTEVWGTASHGEGWNGVARAHYSHVEGSSCVTGVDANDSAALGAHAEGAGSMAGGGIGPHAEGYGAVARAQASHAEGAFTTASGAGAHAEGEDTQAVGWRAHAEGSWTQARGDSSHSQGMATLASGDRAFAAGDSSIAIRETQFVLAGGNFADDSSGSFLPPPARGDAQTSLLVLRAQTRGDAAGETVDFSFGTHRNQHFVLENDKAYDIKATIVAAGTVDGRRYVTSIETHTVAHCCEGGTSRVEMHESRVRSPFTGSGARELTVLTRPEGERLVWSLATGYSRARINAVMRVEFTEVRFP